MERSFGYARVLSSGAPVPLATVDVYNLGTLVHASIFSDNSGTVLANPFTANVDGYFDFYAANSRYDVRFSGGATGLIPTPYTWGDILLYDPSAASNANIVVINVKASPYNAVGNGIADDTTALLAAIAAGKAANTPVYLPPGTYKITSSLAYTGLTPEWLFGPGYIKNNCAAGNASIVCTDAAYKYFRPTILGDVAFPNDGIQLKSSVAGNLGCYNIDITDAFLCPNGTGIHVSDSDIINIIRPKYWPSGQNLGATGTNALFVHAILADGIGACNLYTIDGLNTSGYATTAQGGSAIKWNAAASENIHISNIEAEGALKTSIDFTNVTAFGIDNCYVTATTLNFKGCEYGCISLTGEANTTINLGGGSVPTSCFDVIVRDTTAKELIIDAFCDSCGAENCNFQAGSGYSNSGTHPVTININGAGVGLFPDQLGQAGMAFGQATDTHGGTLNDWLLLQGRHIRWTSTPTINGLLSLATKNLSGDERWLIATGGAFSIAHQAVGSAAANRIITPTAGTITVNVAALVVYDGTTLRWRVITYS